MHTAQPVIAPANATMANVLKILILEDDQTDAYLLERELRQSNLKFTALTVETKVEFEEALLNFKPDLILSDYSLPSFDGLTAFHIAQQSADIPFLIVSGIIGEENAVELIRSGITDYVLKDKLFTLSHKISRALHEHQVKKEKTKNEERIRDQNKKLLEIAFLQSHQVRVPVAHIIGLFDLFRFEEPAHPVNAKVLTQLKAAAENLDTIIQEIVLKTYEVNNLLD